MLCVIGACCVYDTIPMLWSTGAGPHVRLPGACGFSRDAGFFRQQPQVFPDRRGLRDRPDERGGDRLLAVVARVRPLLELLRLVMKGSCSGEESRTGHPPGLGPGQVPRDCRSLA